MICALGKHSTTNQPRNVGNVALDVLNAEMRGHVYIASPGYRSTLPLNCASASLEPFRSAILAFHAGSNNITTVKHASSVPKTVSTATIRRAIAKSVMRPSFLMKKRILVNVLPSKSAQPTAVLWTLHARLDRSSTVRPVSPVLKAALSVPLLLAPARSAPVTRN